MLRLESKNLNLTLAAHNFFKWVEILLLAVFLTFFGWFFYTNYCVANCTVNTFESQYFITFIQFSFIIFAVVNSLRIGLVYLIHDPDDEQETLFYLSLFGLFLSYTIYGIYYPTFLALSSRTQIDSPILFVELILLGGTVLSFLNEKDIWEKSNFFVKFRISLSFLHLLLLIINPQIGIFASIIIFPLMVLARNKVKLSS